MHSGDDDFRIPRRTVLPGVINASYAKGVVGLRT